MKIVVRNLTRNTLLADAAEVADTSEKRRAGLLKHDRLDPGQGLWIVPCESVHSFFMKFAIDLVYLDRNKKVRKVRHRMVPWRVSACLSAHSILELPAGAVATSGTKAGDQLEIEDKESEVSPATGGAGLNKGVTSQNVGRAILPAAGFSAGLAA